MRVRTVLAHLSILNLQMLMVNGSKPICATCAAQNDTDFCFCKLCGSGRAQQNRNLVDSPHSTIYTKTVFQRIDSRIEHLDKLLDSSNYSKQKCQLKTDLESFLTALSPSLTLMNALPTHLRKFLIFKEGSGRTQVHNTICDFRGQQGTHNCGCPKSMAAKSVDSLIGKIRAIFRDIGRSGDWNPVLCLGNPTAAPLIKRHLKSVTLEQTRADVVKKQAIPLMFDKLAKLCRHISYVASIEKDNIVKFLLLRDKAYFSVICHSGDRGGDLGILTANRIFELPDSGGILITHTAGKVASIHHPNNVILLPSKDLDICPIRHLREYLNFAEKSGIHLSQGYLFRVRSVTKKSVADKPVTSAVMSDRLKSHLLAVNLYEGESSHSSRRGCAITLRLLGLNDEKVNQHIGWNSRNMLNHYSNIGKLCGPNSVATILSDAADSTDKDESQLCKISKTVTSMQALQKFYFH